MRSVNVRRDVTVKQMDYELVWHFFRVGSRVVPKSTSLLTPPVYSHDNQCMGRLILFNASCPDKFKMRGALFVEE